LYLKSIDGKPLYPQSHPHSGGLRPPTAIRWRHLL